MIKPKKTLANIEPYSIDEFYTNYDIKLDSNENPYGPSEAVIQAIRNFDVQKIKFYPAYGELVDKLSNLTGAKKENFILTNGCDEAINVVLNTFLEKDDEILSFSPTFSMPILYTNCIGAKFREIPYKIKWQFTYEDYVKNINNETKIIYITSPNNPTGEIVSPNIIKKLLLNYKDKLIVLDCTYINFSNIDKMNYYSLVQEFDNLVILKSFSKDFALAGFRLGYIYSNKNIIEQIKKVTSPYNVNAAATVAGIAALSDLEYFNKTIQKIKTSRNKLADEIQKLGYTVINTEANFILVDFGDIRDFICQKLLNNNIKVKYFKTGELKGYFRITAPKEEDISKILKVLEIKPLLVFDMDGVLFDVNNSYRLAIKKTFEHFAGKPLKDEEIQAVKNQGGMSNDWKVTEYLLQKYGVYVEYDKITEVFQNLFFNPDNTGSKGLIDNEEIVFDKNFFEKIKNEYDCAIFTGRPQKEAFHSLEKYNIKKYFSFFICNEDVPNNPKPSPLGLEIIKKHCLFSDIFYFGDTVDDIEAGKKANVKRYGIIPPNAKSIDETKEKLIEFGANDVFQNPEEIIEKITAKDALCK